MTDKQMDIDAVEQAFINLCEALDIPATEGVVS